MREAAVPSVRKSDPQSSAAGELRWTRGIGPKRAAILEKLGIRSFPDLIQYYPRRHEDRSHFVRVKDIVPGEPVTLQLEILSAKFKPIPRLPMIEVTAGDESGAVVCVWYRQVYLLKHFKAGRKIVVYGRAEMNGRRLQFSSPEFELIDETGPSIHTGRIVPVYGLTEGISQKVLRSILFQAVQKPEAASLPDYLPESIRKESGFIPRAEALSQIHFPEDQVRLDQSRRRLIFDEFLGFQLALQKEFHARRLRSDGTAVSIPAGLITTFAESLPFNLTGEQTKAIHELTSDLTQQRPMNRLLQGDVGSGKTVVAAYAFLALRDAGMQSAMLVPTEILAEQHYRTLKKFLEPFKVKIALFTKSTEPKRRERMIAELKQGKIDLAIGTHALLQDDVQFKNLTLVVIDEQHKFGVAQRSQLLERKPRPHFLIMTATPIPRSLALAFYAEADFSSIRELPPGRLPVKTFWISRARQNDVWEYICTKLAEGRQAYIVFPLIEDSEKADLKAAETEFKKLKTSAFKDFTTGLIHGRTSRDEREKIMQGFLSGEVKVLFSTTVIEVGVDQPNASIMVIENAERFGLAQLHQLRGRIGRGKHESECYLFGEPASEEGKMRLRAFTKIHDGFQIAEEDLKIRGPGDLWGERQSGMPFFKLAHPVWNEDLLKLAKRTAEEAVAQKPEPMWVKKYLAETVRSY